MRTSLEHLPGRKRRELERIVEILHREFSAKVEAATSARRKRGRILKIILFGSHARGGWVEDHGSGYYSDYDILVIVNGEEFADFSTWWAYAEDRILMDERIRTVTNFIVHPLSEVNARLKEGRYFFSDIVSEGVMLYELKETRKSGNVKYKLAAPTPPDAEAALQLATEYYEFWMGNAKTSLSVANHCMAEGHQNEAAFNLHQAVERCYAGFLLTKTLYVPPTHNIKFLRSLCEDMAPALRAAWPRTQKPHPRRFEQLKKAYVEARYSRHFEITQEDLEWLEERAKHLSELVGQACREHLETWARGLNP